ncbi:dihydrodipicolinate synthase family protein [Cellulosimicrobium marinum]|uniref:dihydrodipicolinate synthase family protein n=1 Tax=Cellulosimicrobium marinum TaxID=1638992 RepID=UPI001E528781|nr:dihydrodipicolinate synthase family protein [Cellulosimicrobium marinum]MCB7138009.1 dihydrodipicolinate synthase family protein [Cellulosimicrobium marinum]
MLPFRGLLAYPVTPLGPDGAPDLGVLSRLVLDAARAGVDGVAVLASSGAGVTFDAAERDAVVRAAVEAAASAGPRDSADRASDRVPVHAAVSGASTREVVARARAAQRAGADGLVLAPFSYVPLVDAEVVALFGAVADAVDLPVCFYNKPVQTGYDLSPEVFARLVHDTTVVAVKDPAVLPTRDHDRVDALRAAGPGVSVGLSGDVPLLDDAPPADAWHTGIAALAPVEYLAVRRERADGTPTPEGEASRRWLLEVARATAAMRPVSALHALANALGVPTAPPRGPSLPVTAAEKATLRDLVARRPALPVVR